MVCCLIKEYIEGMPKTFLDICHNFFLEGFIKGWIFPQSPISAHVCFKVGAIWCWCDLLVLVQSCLIVRLRGEVKDKEDSGWRWWRWCWQQWWWWWRCLRKLVGEAEDKVNSGLLQLSPNPFPLIWLVPLALCKRSNIEHQCHLLLS